jgi:hypothetical protein
VELIKKYENRNVKYEILYFCEKEDNDVVLKIVETLESNIQTLMVYFPIYGSNISPQPELLTKSYIEVKIVHERNTGCPVSTIAIKKKSHSEWLV